MLLVEHHVAWCNQLSIIDFVDFIAFAEGAVAKKNAPEV